MCRLQIVLVYFEMLEMQKVPGKGKKTWTCSYIVMLDKIAEYSE
jgi:hypothetical protein